MLNFKGGIKPDSHKYTKNIPIIESLPPKLVKLSTYNDTLCVSLGDNVLIGQKLTINNKAHSPVCGKVVSIENGYISIENNNEQTVSFECIPYSKKLSDSTFTDILSFIKNKGIFFDGDFLDEKLKKATEKSKIIIVSCGETTPFVCSRNRILTEFKKEIVFGTRILMKALNVSKAAITLESSDFKNKFLFNKIIKKNDNITILTHTSKYPADNHVLLKNQFINKYYNHSKEITEDNIFVINCEEVVTLFNSFKSGLPMINRVVTIDGDSVKAPKNLLAPIGISYNELFLMCNAETENISEIVTNNPVIYINSNFDSVITKDTQGVFAFSKKTNNGKIYSCISCHRCINACPVGLNPRELLQQNLKNNNCISCGSCTYICPAKIDFSSIYTLTEESGNE